MVPSGRIPTKARFDARQGGDMKIVFAALFAVSLGVACSVQFAPPSPSDGVSTIEATSTSAVVQEESGGTCICDADNCNYNGCTCDANCSSGAACVACCKEICKACGSACIKTDE